MRLFVLYLLMKAYLGRRQLAIIGPGHAEARAAMMLKLHHRVDHFLATMSPANAVSITQMQGSKITWPQI